MIVEKDLESKQRLYTLKNAWELNKTIQVTELESFFLGKKSNFQQNEKFQPNQVKAIQVQK